MTIGAISVNPLLSLGLTQKSRNDAQADFAAGQNVQANTARAPTILPSSSAAPLSFETVMSLQRLDEPAPAPEAPTATEIFLEEARKDPMERMREQILAELGMTEESLAQLPPDEKRMMEDKIRRLIEEKLREAMNAGEAPADSDTAMLTSLA